MDTNDRKVRTSKRNFIIALALLLITNILMGVILMEMSKKTLKDQVEQRMLDVANSAAAQLDGDELKKISPAEKDSEIYKNSYKILQSFQNSIELEYIYVIYPMGNDRFTFGIDPDQEDPGEFGELIEATDALKNAARGKADVDDVPHSDDWGRFYSAYSPFYDSEGNIVGIVGVDFDADWYDEKFVSDRAVAAIITMVALTIGIVLSFVIMSQNRKRFIKMLNSMAELDGEIQKLDAVIMKNSAKKLDMLPEDEGYLLRTLASGEENKIPPANEYDELHTSIESVYNKLQKYVKYLETDVYNDATTGVKNKLAYKNKIEELDEEIAAGTANFSVAFFDINGLKKIYTHNGYEAGESIMFECAKLLKAVFGKAHVYHITGDEFVVLINQKSRFDMQDLFSEFDDMIKAYNAEHIMDSQLSVAKGFATFDKEQYSNYRQIFIDAEARCRNDKEAFYKGSTY